MKKYLISLCFFLSCSSILLAQIPGHWEKHIVCDHCTTPENIIFADSIRGFILSDGTPNYAKSNSYRTSDGGKSWIHISDTVRGIDFNALFSGMPILYTPEGFIMSYYISGLCTSHDTGRTWLINPTPSDKAIKGGFIASNSKYYILTTEFFTGSKPQVMFTVDSGRTFLLISDSIMSTKTAHTPIFNDSTNVWLSLWSQGDSRYQLYHSVDDGKTWNESFPVDTNKATFFFYSIVKGSSKGRIYLLSSGSMQILGQKYDFLFTTDNGITWGGSTKNNGNIYILQNSRNAEVWAVMNDQHTIGYSDNNGKDWFYDSVTFKNDLIQSMIWKDSTHANILCYQDSTTNLYKYIPPTYTVNSTVYFQTGAPFKIFPTITSDRFHFLPTQPLNGVIAVYDILGRQVLKTPLNVQIGQQQIFSLSGFLSGIYFVTVNSNGELNTGRVIKE